MTDNDRPWSPIPGDPDAPRIGELFDATADWLLASGGDYHTAAAQTWRRDGTGFQTVVLLEWPARRNKTGELEMVRLMIDPRDARGLADVLTHTARWLERCGLLPKGDTR